jgi:hypothetical protein
MKERDIEGIEAGVETNETNLSDLSFDDILDQFNKDMDAWQNEFEAQFEDLY